MLWFCVCQGMDTVTRQTSQHLEFEPEWEGAFNLQLKMEDSLVMFTEWCASDVSFLFRVFWLGWGGGVGIRLSICLFVCVSHLSPEDIIRTTEPYATKLVLYRRRARSQNLYLVKEQNVWFPSRQWICWGMYGEAVLKVPKLIVLLLCCLFSVTCWLRPSRRPWTTCTSAGRRWTRRSSLVGRRAVALFHSRLCLIFFWVLFRRPDMTFAVDWALNQLSIYLVLSFYASFQFL